jgi:hypothetical protein
MDGCESKHNLHRRKYYMMEVIDSKCRVIIFGMRHSDWCYGVP